MSVLIKGMEMPKHCGYCRFRYDGICHALQRTQYHMTDCPLVKVGEPTIEAEPKWIPCSERLPEHEETRYWICTDTGYQCECRWTDNRFGIGNLSGEWGWSIFDTPQYSKVVAWMLLPEPYKETGGMENDDF